MHQNSKQDLHSNGENRHRRNYRRRYGSTTRYTITRTSAGQKTSPENNWKRSTQSDAILGRRTRIRLHEQLLKNTKGKSHQPQGTKRMVNDTKQSQRDHEHKNKRMKMLPPNRSKTTQSTTEANTNTRKANEEHNRKRRIRMADKLQKIGTRIRSQ